MANGRYNFVNPNDGNTTYSRKKTFLASNMHYMSSNAVLPGSGASYDLGKYLKSPYTNMTPEKDSSPRSALAEYEELKRQLKDARSKPSIGMEPINPPIYSNRQSSAHNNKQF